MCGITGYYIDTRIKSLDESKLKVMAFRHSDDGDDYFCTLESFVCVNFSGALVVRPSDYQKLFDSEHNDPNFKKEDKVCVVVNDSIEFLDDGVVVDITCAKLA